MGVRKYCCVGFVLMGYYYFFWLYLISCYLILKVESFVFWFIVLGKVRVILLYFWINVFGRFFFVCIITWIIMGEKDKGRKFIVGESI